MMVIPTKIGKIQAMKDNSDYSILSFVLSKNAWKKAPEINYTKYNIKETDMRIKTATFTSPDYFDLTTGRFFVRISSKYHENFAGVILDVDYDEENGLYNYQCQDWSRIYIWQAEMVMWKTDIYNLLVNCLTQFEIGGAFKTLPSVFPKSVKKYWKDVLSGLRPLSEYDQSLYEGNRYKGNPFKVKPKIIVRTKPLIEIIRDLVYSQLGYFDVWFNERAVLQIEPLSKTDWESTGLHLTTGAALKQKYKFSTTNAITRTYVQGTGTTGGKGYNLDEVKSGALDLTMFFGRVSTSISDPVSKNTTSAASGTSNSTKNNSKNTTNLNTDNPYGTKKKEVWITIDNIFGPSADRKIMNDFAKQVQKAGWTTHVGNVGPSYHYAHAPGYSWSGKVNNAVWFVIYGGACAGTLYEAATATWYRKPLVTRGSRTVVGFIHPPCGDIRKGGKYYKWLPRAHDDNFSPAGFTGISNPGDFLTKKAIPWMYAKNGTALANSFLQGGDNPEACKKNWKFY